MKKMLFAGVFLALASLGVSAPARADGTTPLNQSELGRLFPGTFLAVVNSAYTVRIVARSNGTLSGAISGHQDDGRWSVKSGRLCIAWNTWLNRRANCTAIVSSDGWYHGNGVKFRKL